jgi:N12 class adenine-specific DNA methylase
MSFKDYLKDEIDWDFQPKSSMVDYEEPEQTMYVKIANLIVHDDEMIQLMKHEGLTIIEDYREATEKFKDFVIRHLDEIKQKFHVDVTEDEIEKEWKELKYGF